MFTVRHYGGSDQPICEARRRCFIDAHDRVHRDDAQRSAVCTLCAIANACDLGRFGDVRGGSLVLPIRYDPCPSPRRSLPRVSRDAGIGAAFNRARCNGDVEGDAKPVGLGRFVAGLWGADRIRPARGKRRETSGGAACCPGLGNDHGARNRVLFGCRCVSGLDWQRIQRAFLHFVVWLFMLDWIGISAAMFWIRRGRIWADIAPQIRDGAIGGFLGTISYGAALWAFTLSEAANVTAIRETSVVFGAIFGAVFLKEAFGPRRIAAASLLALGLVMLEFAP